MKIIYIILSIMILLNCKTKNTESINLKNETIKREQNQKENFNTFYKQFYSNKQFQISRLKDTLNGLIKYWDEEGIKIVSEKWNKKNITLVSDRNTLNRYYKNLQYKIIKNDTVTIENYWISNSGFFIERRYKIIKGKWYLVYYDLFNL